MGTTEEQLVSFFLHSMFVYPVTNYLVSSKRSYARWKGACYAILFLALISTCHVIYENREKGPNHYNLLGVSRECPTAVLKKAYRNLSLELHPDKNKSPQAPEQFQKVKHAFDVLLNPDTRQVYDRLGDAGVKVSAQTVIDHKYIIIQMLVYYFSSIVFAFLMTFAEPSGDAMSAAFFGLTAMMLIECALVLEQFKIPVWLLSRNTSYDVVSLLHRLYPAFMNGCRCIVGAFVIDHKSRRIEALLELSESAELVTVKTAGIIQGAEVIAQAVVDRSSSSQKGGSNNVRGVDGGSMADALRSMQRSSAYDSVVAGIESKAALILDPVLLRRQENPQTDYSWLRNILVYLVARFIIVKSNVSGRKTV